MIVNTGLRRSVGPSHGTLNWRSALNSLLPAGFSLTRDATNTPGTYFNSAGTLTNAVVNLCLQSQTFDNASWNKPNVTVTANAVVAPDGTTTADLVYPNLSGGNMYTYQSVTTTATAWTFSYYAKYAGIQWVCTITLNGIAYAAYFDIQNGVVGTVGAGHSARIYSAGNGWYRCEITTTTAPAGIGNVFIESVDADNNAGVVTKNGTAGVYLWGAQLELGSAATTYIPTTTVAGGAPRGTYRWNGSAWVFDGTIVESAATQLVTPTASIRDLTNAAWVKTTMTTALTSTGADGTANSATRCTASAGNATVLQTLVAAATSRTVSFLIKRVTGTGNIELTQDGATYTNIATLINSSVYTQVQLNATQLNASFGIRTVSYTHLTLPTSP
jgi:hypothetical protein